MNCHLKETPVNHINLFLFLAISLLCLVWDNNIIKSIQFQFHLQSTITNKLPPSSPKIHSLIVQPKHIFWNQSVFPLILHATQGKYDYLIPAHCRAAIHFQEAISDRVFQLGRPLPGWRLSGRFMLQQDKHVSVKTYNQEEDKQLEVTLNTIASQSFTLTTVSIQQVTPFVVVRNYCPFAVEISQKEDNKHSHFIPGYSSFNFTFDEPLCGTDLAIHIPTACPSSSSSSSSCRFEDVDRVIAVELQNNHDELIPTRVPQQWSLAKTIDVIINGKQMRRSVRLGDHILVMMDKKKNDLHHAGSNKSIITLALPLHDCVIIDQKDYLSLKINSRAWKVLSSIKQPFTKDEFNTVITEHKLSKTYFAFQDLIEEEFIKPVSTKSNNSEQPYFIVNAELLKLLCTITIQHPSLHIQLNFPTPSIAAEWTKQLKFEIATCYDEFPRMNWLNVPDKKSVLRDLHCKFGIINYLLLYA